jgi:hypothetical protein
VHAEVLREPPQAELVEAAVVEQGERGVHDLAATVPAGVVGPVASHSVDKWAEGNDISVEFNTVKFSPKYGRVRRRSQATQNLSS